MADDFAKLLTEIRSNQQAGEQPGARLLQGRIGAKHKGKSGGARVSTGVKIAGETVFLLPLYDQSEQVSLFERERDELLRANELV